MTSSELSSKLMSLAVRGYGLLAAPCRKYLSIDVRGSSYVLRDDGKMRRVISEVCSADRFSGKVNSRACWSGKLRSAYFNNLTACVKLRPCHFGRDSSDTDDNKIHKLPSFLQSLASIAKQLEIGSEGWSEGILIKTRFLVETSSLRCGEIWSLFFG